MKNEELATMHTVLGFIVVSLVGFGALVLAVTAISDGLSGL